MIMIVNFLIMKAAPGDPVDFLVSGVEGVGVPKGYVEMLKAKYGFDKPVHVQMVIYFQKLLKGDFGYSFYYHQPVFKMLLSRLRNTLILTSTSLIIETIGIMLGVMASKKVYSLTDNSITIGTLLFYNIPNFWLGMMLLLIFGLYIPIFPIGGIVTIGVTGDAKLLSILWHLILPVACLSLGRIALYTRYTRASMLEINRLDYITTARAKGCNEKTVLYNHTFRNALLPIITVVALRLRTLFTGALLVESVFSWPGLGKLVFDSVIRRDFNVLMANFFLLSIITIFFNLVADVLYAYVDPRVMY